MIAIIRRELNDLAINIYTGIRLGIFCKNCNQYLKLSIDQAFLLVLFNTLLSIAKDYISNLPDPVFSYYGISGIAMGLLVSFIIAYIFYRASGCRPAVLKFIIFIYAISPVFILVNLVFSTFIYTPNIDYRLQWLGWWLIILWQLVVISLYIMKESELGRIKSLVTGLAMVLVVWSFSGFNYQFWHSNPDSSSSKYDRYAKINQEQLFDSQFDLIKSSAAKIRNGKNGRPDLYFLGFAGYAMQDVFKKEVTFIQDLMDRRFGTLGRSVSLINHIDTIYTRPLATASNFKRMIRAISRKMDIRQDVLFMYFTSHGSKKHRLSVNMWPLELNKLTPQNIKTTLDESRIKWKILLISACYSGGFLEPLKDEYTLIMTASAADKRSFGCSDTREFTYFGEEVFKHQLAGNTRLIDSFHNAIQAIKSREKNEKKDLSQPQLFIGKHIAAKIRQLEKHISRHGRIR